MKKTPTFRTTLSSLFSDGIIVKCCEVQRCGQLTINSSFREKHCAETPAANTKKSKCHMTTDTGTIVT